MTTTSNGAALRAIRERSGLSVRDLIALLKDEGIDVHEDHIRNVETDARHASHKLIAACARVLKVPVTALLATVREASDRAESA